MSYTPWPADCSRDEWSRIDAADAGYRFRIVAENVAAGRLTPESAVQGRMESPEHRANILNCALRDTGVGVAEVPDDPTYGIYWTQLFATPL